MSWSSHAIKKYLSKREVETFDQRLSRYRHARVDPEVQTTDRVAQLEDDLARALLLIEALAEACVRHGVVSREQIAKAAEKLDLLDGVADGKLDPSVIRPKNEEQE